MTYQSKAYSRCITGLDVRFFELIRKCLKMHDGDTVLEIGCNRGVLLARIQEQGVSAFGIDVNEEAIREGVAENLEVMDATDLKFADETFHKIYSLHTIEHIRDIRQAFQEIARVLKPGGRVVVVYPAEPIRGLFAIRSSILAYKNVFLAREIHIHKLNPKRVENLAQETGLRYVESRGPLVPFLQYLTILEKSATEHQSS